MDKLAKQRIQARRRVVLRAGLVALGVVVLGIASTACIFDQSTYQGGGRLGRAATAQQENLGPGEEEEEEESSSSSSSSSSGSSVPDAALD